jgi:hypothetical protein
MPKKPVPSVRKPPPAPSAALEQFIAGKPATAEERSTLVTRKRKGVTLQRQTVYLPPELAHRLAVWCATHRRKISETVSEAIRAHLDEHPDG